MTRTAPIIGLTGWAGAGKSTVASLLAAEHGYMVKPLAGPVIDGLRALDPIIGWVAGQPVRLNAAIDSLGWDVTKRTYAEARRLAQRFGTEVGRQQFGADVWVDRMWWTLQGVPDMIPVVIPDVRFPNEAQLVYDIGGFIVRVERPGLARQSDHESEQYAGNILPDWVLLNAGSLSDLTNETRKVAERVKQVWERRLQAAR